MEIFIKEHKEDNYGKLVDMSSLFAAVMLSVGKATRKPNGAKIGDLIWCTLGEVVIKLGEEKVGDCIKSKYHIYEEHKEIMQKDDRIKEETAYVSPLKSSVIFRYENINEVKNIAEGKTYIVKEQPLMEVLKSNHLWKKDWDENTYLTNECIENLNSSLYYNHYTQHKNRNQQIIV